MSRKPGRRGFLFSAKHRETGYQRLPFQVRDDFFTSAQADFLKMLLSAAGDDFIICPKTYLADLITVAGSEEKLQLEGGLGGKQIDFLICDRKTLSPRVAVVLSGETEEMGKMHRAEIHLDDIFDAAGLPLVRFFSDNPCSPGDLRECLLEAAGGVKPQYSQSLFFAAEKEPGLESMAQQHAPDPALQEDDFLQAPAFQAELPPREPEEQVDIHNREPLIAEEVQQPESAPREELQQLQPESQDNVFRQEFEAQHEDLSRAPELQSDDLRRDMVLGRESLPADLPAGVEQKVNPAGDELETAGQEEAALSQFGVTESEEHEKLAEQINGAFHSPQEPAWTGEPATRQEVLRFMFSQREQTPGIDFFTGEAIEYEVPLPDDTSQDEASLDDRPAPIDYQRSAGKRETGEKTGTEEHIYNFSALENQEENVSPAQKEQSEDLFPHLPDLEQLKARMKQEVELAAQRALQSGAPDCPKCGATMVLRTSRRGYQFYVCPRFPHCREVKGLYE